MSKKKKKVHGRSSLPILSVVVAVLAVVVLCAIAAFGGFDKKPSNNPSLPSDGSDAVPSDAVKSDGQDSSGTDKPTPSSGIESSGTEDPGTSETEVEGDPSVFWKAVASTTYDPEKYYLILVNPTRALPDGYQDTIKLSDVQNGYKMDSRIASHMREMIAAAKEDGVTLRLCSAFRTHERQIELYTARIEKIQKNNPDYSWREACLEAARINALPGTSEHETGLCADIVTPSYQTLDEGFANTEAFRWLSAHAAEYGFVMRYPEDKQAVTGIIYESWHYRYVGTEAANEMNRLNMCLEEYIDYLDGQGNV